MSQALAKPRQEYEEGPKRVELRAQPGPQEKFLSSDADIAIYGGSAFSSKTFALLLDDLRHVADKDFRSVTFRRTTNQVRNPGGLWDEARRVYAPFGALARTGSLEMLFPSGAVSKFAHLEYEDDKYGWDGAQIPVIKFDQLEHFTRSQFFYMLSRNRDPSGKIRPYMRATCNPDPESWLAEFVAWWIDQEKIAPDGRDNPRYGYPIWERSGVLRWMHREGDDIHWYDSREELIAKHSNPDLPADHPDQPLPLSVTFIPGRIYDNAIGLRKDPGYLAKLKGLPYVERVRLLGHPQWGGNWKIKAAAGLMFQRHWCPTISGIPEDVDWVRGWDLAGTKPTETSSNPDWTVGVKLGKYRGRNRYVIAAAVRLRDTPHKVEAAIKNTAEADGPKVRIRVPQDPGQAGKAQAAAFVGMLTGYRVSANPVTGDKVTRFGPFSAQAEAGNVDLVEGLPEAYLAALENFPPTNSEGHDDDADATSEAFSEFVIRKGGDALIEFYRRENEKAKQASQAGGGNGQHAPKQAQPAPSQPAEPVVPVRRPSTFPAEVAAAQEQARELGRPVPGLNGGVGVVHRTFNGWGD